MLSYYEEKQKKIEAKRKNYKRQFWVRLFGTIIVAVIVMQIFVGMFLMSEDPSMAFLGIAPGLLAGVFAYRILIDSRGTEERKG